MEVLVVVSSLVMFGVVMIARAANQDKAIIKAKQTQYRERQQRVKPHSSHDKILNAAWDLFD